MAQCRYNVLKKIINVKLVSLFDMGLGPEGGIMKELAKYADWVFYLSLFGLALAAYGAFSGNDLWLAPTQWIEVSMAMVVYALYIKHVK